MPLVVIKSPPCVPTEIDLTHWYSVACGRKYGKSLGVDVLKAVEEELIVEFPVTHAARVQSFLDGRRYDLSKLVETWAISRVGLESDSVP